MIHIEQFDRHTELTDSFIGAVPLTPASAADFLNELIRHAEHQQFVFDLDSTLLNNRPRNAVIMKSFGKEHNQVELIQASADYFQDWSLRNAMKAAGLVSADVERLIQPFQDYWYERFFTSDYCQYDIAIPGATDFVEALMEAGALITYLTGRHEDMREGTAHSLTTLGFPLFDNERVKLLMKPEFEASDDLFKSETLKKIETAGPVFAAFDNEPTHINSYRSTFPDAVCVHLLTDHSMRDVKLLDKIVSISNFVR